MSANKQTIAGARRLCATIQLELKARTFDYARRFPDSDRIKQRGIETPEKIQHGYYKEVAGPSFSATIGTKTLVGGDASVFNGEASIYSCNRVKASAFPSPALLCSAENRPRALFLRKPSP